MSDLYYDKLIRIRDKLVEKILEEPQNRKVAKAPAYVVEIQGVQYYVVRPVYMLDTFSQQTAVRKHLFGAEFNSVEELLAKYNALILQELR